MRKKITIKDIADSANVSKSTVSRVLNNNTPVNQEKRKAVLEAMEELNYKPNLVARSLAGGSSMTIGVVTQNIGSPYYDSVTQGIIVGLYDTDYSPIFADGRWDPECEAAVIKTLVDRNVDGLIMVGGTLKRDELETYSESKPLIIIARTVPGLEEKCIQIDNFQAAKEATAYLIQAGHKRIAHFMGIPEHQDAVDRYRGYQKALEEAGIQEDRNLVVECDFSSPSGVTAADRLLDQSVDFSAIFASNDEMAFGARLALYRRGIKVPDQVSIVGFDDQPNSAFMTPPLTTVAQPAESMGLAAANSLLSLLRNEEYQRPDLESKLIVRESVAKK